MKPKNSELLTHHIQLSTPKQSNIYPGK
uniref:Uncharacterized protein n=1 Tax=Rhizophora mucronata TaxID=61149 RepID=A0A2P2PBR7_RHIMU